MNRLVIPDKILESSFCKECYKYLTVAPIGVHPKGGNICGRCLYGNKSYSTNTLFEFTEFTDSFFPLELFCFACCNKGLFPCINRYDGCNKVLDFHEIREHERVCTVPKTKCPASCGFEGVGSQMLQHFKLDHCHKTLAANHNEFNLDFMKNASQMYLYQSSRNVLFFLKMEYCEEISQISFDTLCLGTLGPAYIKLDFLYGKTNRFSMISNNLNIKKNKTYNMTMKIDNFEMFEARNLLCSFNVIFTDNQ